MEVKLENKLRSKIIGLGGKCWKWTSPQTKGVPDRIILLPGGRVFFVETKWGRNGLSPQQVHIHKILKDLGFNVYTVWNDENLEDFLTEIQCL